MVLSTPAPHAPFTPAPKYKDRFPYEKAPRYEICQKNNDNLQKKNLFSPLGPRRSTTWRRIPTESTGS